MRNPRPQSRGFIAVNTRTHEILSELVPRRETARAIVREHLANDGHAPVGVHQVMMYPGEVYDRATYKF